MDLVVEARGLAKRFGDLVAVRDFDVGIQEGEIYGLVGPNGSGKTTTIRMLVGLLRQDKGEVFILGKKVPDKRLSPLIGYMPQEIAIYPDMTVRGNLRFFGQIYDLEKEQIDKRAEELLAFAGLEEKKNELAVSLSGGLKHRLSFVCSLIHQPRVLFLDEPTVGVDPELRLSFWEFFRELSGRGITTIITTHYMAEAEKCGRVGFLRSGRLIAEGTPEEIKETAGARSLEDAFIVLEGRRG